MKELPDYQEELLFFRYTNIIVVRIKHFGAL